MRIDNNKQSNEIKVFADVMPSGLGIGIHRIAENIKKYTPNQNDSGYMITYVDHPSKADIQFVYAIGDGQLEQIIRWAKPFVLWQICYKTTEKPDIWKHYWNKDSCLALVSYYDLEKDFITDKTKDKYLMTSLGYDPKVFHNNSDKGRERLYDAITFGYVDGESGEVIKDLLKPFPKLVHVGGNIGINQMENEGYVRIEGIDDGTLSRLYNESRYVGAMRYTEGFELPALEGLACGATPIMFDLDDYKRWFDGYALFVNRDTLQKDLLKISREKTKLNKTKDEVQEFLKTRTWEHVMTNYWNFILPKITGVLE